MIVRCDQEVFEMFPDASVHAIVFDGLAAFDRATVAPWKQRAIDTVASSGFTSETVLDAPAVKEWRNAFQRFGVKPSKFRSSIEQLYRRALKQELIETPLPLVNLYCYVSLIEMVPMGAYDLEKVDGDIVIRLSKENETFLGIGDTTPLIAHAGVVVYSDDGGIICWAWNHRDAAHVSLSPETNRAIFFADSSSHESESRAAAAITLLADAVSGERNRFVLNRATPSATV